jgi:hypothetical protein
MPKSVIILPNGGALDEIPPNSIRKSPSQVSAADQAEVVAAGGDRGSVAYANTLRAEVNALSFVK